MNTAETTESAIERVINHFLRSPTSYFTEEDVRWRLMREIEVALAESGASEVTLKDGTKTSAVHGEYPTPFRCSMTKRSFVLVPPRGTARRGHFDIAILSASAAAECDFRLACSQDFDGLPEKLRSLSSCLLDMIVEILLLRNVADPKWKKSIQNAVEDAVQDMRKVAAALDAQDGYYDQPFAKRGIVLLLDNSQLSHPAPRVNAKASQRLFEETLNKEFKHMSPPNTLSCLWITPGGVQRYDGLRPPRNRGARNRNVTSSPR